MVDARPLYAHVHTHAAAAEEQGDAAPLLLREGTQEHALSLHNPQRAIRDEQLN